MKKRGATIGSAGRGRQRGRLFWMMEITVVVAWHVQELYFLPSGITLSWWQSFLDATEQGLILETDSDTDSGHDDCC